jgi:chitodextrinase
VDLRYTRSTEAGVESLRAALPHANLIFLDSSVKPAGGKTEARVVKGKGDAAVAGWVKLIGGKAVMDNGALVGTIPTAQFSPSVNVNIGRRSGGYYFKGTIDEVRIYNRALSAAEIAADMNTPIGGGTDTQPPTAPTSLTATAAGASQINLSWAASTDNVAVAGYRVERCLGAACSSFAQIATPVATAYGDTGLTAGASYSYRVRAADAAGNLRGYSNVATAKQRLRYSPPTAPTNLTATAAGGTGINLAGPRPRTMWASRDYLVELPGAGCSTLHRLVPPQPRVQRYRPGSGPTTLSGSGNRCSRKSGSYSNIASTSTAAPDTNAVGAGHAYRNRSQRPEIDLAWARPPTMSA